MTLSNAISDQLDAPAPDLPAAANPVDLDPMDAVPAELRGLGQWVMWRYEARSGRHTKVPYCPLAGEPRRASVTDALRASPASGQ